jgi:hypothetical protein
MTLINSYWHKLNYLQYKHVKNDIQILGKTKPTFYKKNTS